MEIDPNARALLLRPLIGNLGFNGLDGNPRVIPVWFTFTGDEVQVASPPDAYKCRALRADPRAMISVSTHTAPYDVVSISGNVQIDVIEEPERIAFVSEVAVRYLGEEGGRRYIDSWIKGGHPGPGDLLRLPAGRVRYSQIG